MSANTSTQIQSRVLRGTKTSRATRASIRDTKLAQIIPRESLKKIHDKREHMVEMLRSTSTEVDVVVHDPSVIEGQMSRRSITTEITKNGVSSCQITRTYGLIVYALKYMNISLHIYDRTKRISTKDATMLQNIIKTLYPESNLSGKPFVYNGIHSELEYLQYLQNALIFSYVNETRSPKLRQVDSSFERHFEDGYFDKIHTFAIIKRMLDFEGPIHYFNIVRSLTTLKISCYTSWAVGNLKVTWSKFDIDYNLLMNIPMLVQEMIALSNVFSPSGPHYEDKVTDYKNKLLNNPQVELYIVEILGPHKEPLVDTVKYVLEHFTGLTLPNGGSIKNKKKKIYNKTRTRTKKGLRLNKRTKKTYKKQ
jgi:hypothetical protein